MTVHFVDVGQALTTLIELPCGTMLFDVGSQDDAHQATLLQHLNDFFARRSDLNRTIDLVLISHNHIDHTRSLREVVEAFTVRRYIDNGFTTGERAGDPNWLRGEVEAGRRTVIVRAISGAEITNQPSAD